MPKKRTGKVTALPHTNTAAFPESKGPRLFWGPPSHVLLRKWLWGLFAVVLCYFAFRYIQQEVHLWRLNQEIEAMESEILLLDDKQRQLTVNLNLLDSAESIRWLARERLGLVEEGEILYIFTEHDEEDTTALTVELDDDVYEVED